MEPQIADFSHALKGFFAENKKGAAIRESLLQLGLPPLIAGGLLQSLAAGTRADYQRLHLKQRRMAPFRRRASKLARQLAKELQDSGKSGRYTTSNPDIRELALAQIGVTKAEARKHGLLINPKAREPVLSVLLEEYLLAFAEQVSQIEHDDVPANSSGRQIDARTFVIRRVKRTLLEAMESAGLSGRRHGLNAATAKIAAVLLDSSVSANAVTQAFRGVTDKRYRKPQLPKEE